MQRIINLIKSDRRVQVALLIVALIIIGSQSGFLTGAVYYNPETVQNKVGAIQGVNELIGPHDRDGFITSYLGTGLSEEISCRGSLTIKDWGPFWVTDYKYIVYGKKPYSVDWEEISIPGYTQTYLTGKNPDVIPITGWTISTPGAIWTAAEPYDFQMVGSDYEAIRVDFNVYMSTNILPIGYQWRTLQRDEAGLFNGLGALYYVNTNTELTEEVTPQQTYEIGETVIIRVETGFGGQTVAEPGETTIIDGETVVGTTSTWRVKLRQPPDRGGAVVKEEPYDDDVHAYFAFDITADMYSSTSNNEYSIELWNTWNPMGTLRAYTIDLKANAPGDVTFDGEDYKYVDGTSVGYQVKINTPCTIKYSAEPGATQLPIDHFRVSVVYGTYGELLPTDGPSSPIWIVYTTDGSATHLDGVYSGAVTFTPTRSEYVTVFVNAQDTEGRTNIKPTVFSLWVFAEAPVPPDQIDDETGEHDYWGGLTPDFLPWNPSDYAYENDIWTIVAILLSVVTFLAFLVVALTVPDLKYKIIVVIVGGVVAFIMYSYLMSDLSVLAHLFM